MTIVYILVGVLVGWVIGFFDSNMRTAKKIKAAEEKAELAIREAEKRIAESQGQGQAEGRAAIIEPSLLSFRNINGSPFLELEGVPVNVKTVSADQKNRILELLARIRSWLDAGQPLPTAEKQSTPSSMESRTPPFYPGAGTVPSTPVRGPQPLNDIAQIDAILQTRLANSPLAGMGICLTARTSSGGLQVHVGAQKYPTLADVPDQQIKVMVRSAIAEWEQQHSPAASGGARSSPGPSASAAALTFVKPPPPARPANEREFRSLSIVAQIDTMLQARLENSPLADKGIRLIERTALGGVEVCAGDQKYPSLDDVPDPQIKGVIRAVISEWEKKYTPGM